MNQHFDFNGQIEPYSFVLSYPDHRHLGELVNLADRKVNEVFNGPDELSFTVHRYASGVEEELWNEITSLQYIYVPQMKEYFMIEVELDDGDGTTKTVSGVGAGEGELSQSLIYSLEINTDLDIAREEYTLPTIFYDSEHPERSLLHRTLDRLPNWSIGNIDSTLQNLQRTFSVSDSTVYDFLTGEVAEQFGCMFEFDSMTRTIHAHDLKTVCRECGYRGTYDTKCPKCGSEDLKQYGKDTLIYVDSENLSQDLTLTTDVDSIKNCFRMEAGDDEMTAAVINQNPTGSAYIYHFSPENKALMPQDLVNKLEDYENLVKSYEEESQTLSKNIYISYDKIMELTSTMMPGEKFPPTTAEKEGARLTSDSLSPLGLSRLTEYTTKVIVENALMTWVRGHLESAAYKVEFIDSTWKFYGPQPDGTTSGIWLGKITLTNYADKEDTYTTVPIPIKVWTDYGTYLAQKLENLLEQYNRKEKGNIYDPLKMENLDEFKKACEKYCLNRLKSFADAIEGCLTLMTQEGVNYENPTNEKAELKEKVYDVFVKKLEIVQDEMAIRQKQIDDENVKLDGYLDRHHEIQRILDFEKFLGTEMYQVFLIYKREQVYSNSNYISTNLDNVTIWENATDFVLAAKEELFKSSTYQHQITGSLIDFLSMPEFESLAENFELGNWIHVRIAGDIYRLRLIKIEFNFDDMESLGIEFSDVTKTMHGGDDLGSILSQASSIAGSYNYVKTQVRKSKEQTDLLRDFVNNGLDATLLNIVNQSENSSIKIDENGLLARRYDEVTGEFDPEQIRLINNGIYYTKDNWRTSRAALGRYEFHDPETGADMEGFGLIADRIVSNVVLTKEVGVYNDANTIRLDDNGFTFIADCTDGKNKNIFDISKKYKDENGETKTKDLLTLDSDGDLVFNGSSMKIILDGNLSVKTFDEALSGANLVEQINKSGAVITSVEKGAVRLDPSELVWTATNSSMTQDGTITAKGVDLQGKFYSEATGTEEQPNKHFIRIEEGKIIGGMNTETYGGIHFTKADNLEKMELQSSVIDLNTDTLALKGTVLPTKALTVVTGVVENEDGTTSYQTETINIVNGLIT